MIYSLGDVSGAHFNPAVTAAIVMSGRGKCELNDAMVYVGAQLAAGISAGFTYAFMHHWTTFPLEPGPGFSLMQAGVAEIIFTFVLCFVVLTVATVEESASTVF